MHPEPAVRARSRALLLSWLGFTVALLVLQNSTLEALKRALISDPSLSFRRLEIAKIARLLFSTLRPLDAGALLVALALPLWWLLAEWRGKRLSSAFAAALVSDRSAISSLVLFGATVARFYLAPGEVALGDGPVHAARVFHTAEAFRASALPDWTFARHGGYPLLQFYGPLFYLIAGAGSALFGSPDSMAKLLLFACHVGSGAAVFLWARALGLSIAAGWIAGAATLLSFQHTHLVVWAGAFPVGLLYLFVPLWFASFEWTLRSSARTRLWAFASTTAALFFSHHGHAVLLLQLFAIYAAVRVCFDPGTMRKGVALAITLLALVAGGLLASGFILPLLLEGRWVYQPKETPWLRPDVSFDFVRRSLVWNNRWTGFGAAYLGISLVALAGAGFWRSLKRTAQTQAGVARAALWGAAAAALVATVAGEQAGGRVGSWLVPFLSILAAGALPLAAGPRTAVLCLAFLCVDLFPTTFQSPFRSDRGFLRRGYAELADVLPSERALVGYANAEGATDYLDFFDYSGETPATPIGGYPQGAPHSVNSATCLVDAVDRDAPALSAATLDLLFLWNVGALVLPTRASFAAPERPPAAPTQIGDAPVYGQLPHASPIVASRRVAVTRDAALASLDRGELLFAPNARELRRDYLRDLSVWIARMRLDRTLAMAETLFASADPTSPALSLAAVAEAARMPTGEDSLRWVSSPSVTQSGAREVRIAYEASDACWLQVAYSWYPTLRARIDGAPVPTARSLLGTLLVASPPGSHELILDAPVSTRRRAARIIGPVLGIAATALLAQWRSGRSQERPHRRGSA